MPKTQNTADKCEVLTSSTGMPPERHVSSTESFYFSRMSDQEILEKLQKHRIGLTVEEARKIEQILGRPPTLTEAILWGIQGSEHCSYKSSRRYLKMLPTKAPNVVLGVGEDSGIVEIAQVCGTARKAKKALSKGSQLNEDRYGLIISHESHNHPSQIVPYEGAATGVGGCVRDVACMGGKVIGVLDPLRHGEIAKNEARQIFNGAVSGISGYGNPIGVPNLGGDLYFDPSYNQNCLVNVVAIGMVKESHIIHSFVPSQAGDENWDIIIVGKPTDASGMGGASFASGTLKESEKEKNKGAVQEPNPFLKRHILVSTYDLFEIIQKKGLIHQVSYKDMGAGGVTCSTVEQVAKNGLGAEIDLEKVHVAIKDLPPSVIACSETQERFTWMCHPSLTTMILDHYNKKWDLPSIADNAGASLIGKVTKGNFILNYRGTKVVDAPSESITEGLSYDRPHLAAERKLEEPVLKIPKSPALFKKYLTKTFLQLLASENIASRKPVYERYDKQVQGYVVLEAGLADAGVIAPLLDESSEDVTPAIRKTGMALSTDSNPRYGLISAYHAARNAVVESMRNVAAVGAYPQAITDCLNYGNPEKPEQMAELIDGIKGIKEACEGIKLKNYPDFATPVISGNVSLYNENQNTHISPTAVICCVGKIDDAYKAVTFQFKKPGSLLYLFGKRKNELGGSEYYRLFDQLGANVPVADLREVQKEIYTMVDAVEAGLVLSAHDISEGGLAVTVAEMAFGGWGKGKIGATVDLDQVSFEPASGSAPKSIDIIQKLFSETGGFVVEVAPASQKKFLKICAKNQLTPCQIGKTTVTPQLAYKNGEKSLIKVSLKESVERWLNGLREKIV